MTRHRRFAPSTGAFIGRKGSTSILPALHLLRHAIRSCCQRIKYANCYHTQRKRKIRTLLQSETGSDFSCLVGAGGFEPPKLKAADLQSVPIGHSGTRPYSFVAHPYAGRLVYFSMRRGICQLSFLLFFSKFKQHPTKAGKDAMTGGFYGNRALLWCNCRKEKAEII